ncbi:MAG: DNA double-strand break repair nuclease NurA [Actinomycetota bacterium]
MLVLRADPWSPEFGADVSIALDDLPVREVVVDPTVETPEWSRPIRPPETANEPVTFVDGVRRVDLRILAQENGTKAWGLLGSYAAGGVRCDGRAAFVGETIQRVLILAPPLSPETLALCMGRAVLEYVGHAGDANEPLACLDKLQRLMREAEGRLAAELGTEWGPAGLVILDGPLHYPIPPGVLAVGVVKRMQETYLEGEPAALMPRLQPGERTPVFALGRQKLDRYAWYQRLVPLRLPWHELSGIVRCEVRMSLGLGVARSTADRVAALLPEYAGQPGLDPRAPQNLSPVGALEAHLHRRLGHAGLIRRALQAHLVGTAL